MRKKILSGIVGLLLAVSLIGCTSAGQQGAKETESASEASSKETSTTETSTTEMSTVETPITEIPIFEEPSVEDQKEELLKDSYGDYQREGGEIAFVSDGTIMDGSYNQAIYEGVQMYALAAGVTFSYYLVEENGLEGYQEAITRAVSNQAEIIVCGGYDFGEAVGTLQAVYPEIEFLMMDGVPTDAKGNSVDMENNVHCVTFREEEAGYLAGYLTVMEGYRRLGFIGGEEVPSVIRYGYGYLQGIRDAAEDMDLENVTVDYWYSGSFRIDSEVAAKASEWYANGTEVIFACGGVLYESVLEAAENEGGLLIGVDVDQSALSDRFLTSAVKGLANGVIISLDDYYASGGQWSESFAGQEVRYGIEDNCAGIPVLDTEWRFRNVTVEDFYEVYVRIKQGEVIISDETGEPPQTFFPVNDGGTEK